MTETSKKQDHRTFLSLADVGDKLEMYANTDPRFATRSACARHLIELGMQADKEARENALKSVTV